MEPFTSRWVALSSLGMRICSWSYYVLLCCAPLISLGRLLLSEEKQSSGSGQGMWVGLGSLGEGYGWDIVCDRRKKLKKVVGQKIEILNWANVKAEQSPAVGKGMWQGRISGHSLERETPWRGCQIVPTGIRQGFPNEALLDNAPRWFINIKRDTKTQKVGNSFFFDYFFLFYEYECLPPSMSACHLCAWYLRRPGKGVRSLESGVTDDCELRVGAGIKPCPLEEQLLLLTTGPCSSQKIRDSWWTS